MSGDKLNTAEFDSKGRCVRHPAIRLRKKKLLGGWKVLIGHCPECCLDEMRRVRDEIDGHDDDDHHHRHRGVDAKKSKKSSKKSSSGRDKGHSSSSKKRTSKSYQRGGSDEHSGIESEGYDPRVDGAHRTSASNRRYGKGDGESEATGSTSQMTDSVSGSGSVVSEQYVPRNHNFGGPGYFPPPVQAPPGHLSQPQQGGERTMVLSMAYMDPQTGQRGTYTGQVDSVTLKPDGKGTLYYSNGAIAEGTWSRGVLVVEGDEDYRGGAPSGRHSMSHGRQEHNRNDFRRSDSRSRSGLRQEPTAMMGHPSHNGGGRTSMGGNLDKLELLGGPRHRARGASASVQSYNSRASRGSHFGSQSMAGVGGAGGSVFLGGLDSTGYYDDRGRVHGGRYNRDP
mmetsp:Transcript_15483/g.31298  ORF Transcript_15483/g.31298 Transcript_15483/m.31298 type:complete len:395 (+) Transcript_15483:191-1375(+)